jgi:hypothetical protein
MDAAANGEALAERAAHYQRLVLDVAYGPGGMIHDYPHFETRRPLQDGDELDPIIGTIAAGIWGGLSPKPRPADLWYGEDTLWATGAFLESQLRRFRVTGEEEARRVARKCFQDLSHYFALSDELEPGVLGKPHGGRPGGTWSYDQSAIPVVPYLRYALELGDQTERATAQRNLVAHSEMYLRRDWTINAFGNELAIIGTGHPSGLKIVAAGYASAVLTHDEVVRERVLAALSTMTSGEGLPWPFPTHEALHNLWYWAYCADFFHTNGLAEASDWIGHLDAWWKAATTYVREDGLALGGTYDVPTGLFTAYEHSWQSTDTWEPSWRSPTGYAMMPWESLTAAALGLLARSHGLDDEGHVRAERTLHAVDEDKLRWWWDDGSVPDEIKPLTMFFSTCTAVLWQLVYWSGREQGLWSPV